jgi:hypothetical protein
MPITRPATPTRAAIAAFAAVKAALVAQAKASKA